MEIFKLACNMRNPGQIRADFLFTYQPTDSLDYFPFTMINCQIFKLPFIDCDFMEKSKLVREFARRDEPSVFSKL